MSDSLLKDVLHDLSHLRAQTYFKSALAALSHAMEDLLLAGEEAPLVIANFQQERFYRQEIHRYRKISQRTDHVYVLAAPEQESGFAIDSSPHEVIPLREKDELSQEWHLVILGQHYSACLICQEHAKQNTFIDQLRRFEGLWTFDPQVSTYAARWLLGRISTYRPELTPKVEQAWQQFNLTVASSEKTLILASQNTNTDIFGQRLVTYLQAGQYRLLKAYRKITAQQQRERLLNRITVAIRNSLTPHDVLNTTVQELGKTFHRCRCLLYCCHPTDTQVTIEYEFVHEDLSSLCGEVWALTDNPLIQVAMTQQRALTIANTTEASNLQQHSTLQAIIQHWQIRSWVFVPIRCQGKLLGMIEIHSGGKTPYTWQKADISLVEAIASQAGLALAQTQAYTDLETLNHQLKAIERTQRNLIAIVGHELRTPLSTIQICLESIETEPDMPAEFLQTMLDTALTDSERMRKLIQNFLILARLETGRETLCLESIQIQEVINLALNSVRANWTQASLPDIQLDLSPQLPTIRADGEGLVKVLTELLDNACKFTDPDGEVRIHAHICGHEPTTRYGVNDSDHPTPMMEVVIADTGRGIETSQLEAIFEWFSQEEDYLRRTVGGVGLGLAICRQLILGMGGKIWAYSAGKLQGSQFHFTVPIEPSAQYQTSLFAYVS